MATLRFCQECNNLLYPKTQPGIPQLIFACRMCNFSELTEGSGLVYRNDLLTVTREQPGVTTDLAQDLTLMHSNMKCPKCGNTDCVTYQDQSKRKETRMTLFYVCTAPHCGYTFQDPALVNAQNRDRMDVGM
ncbi:probable DNA-directed RNA polymerase II 14.5 kDa polypeptide [Serendipita indica DSM 11827]|uniref:DNA-directed RNA polymerase II subunit RPB9 n=1 Tax=Serendipita indica (strain DSM 11827) TaxID=1109443 RepID=G4TRD7_SERID|nr:probable DNA-directed RNA polymerase II 14.5 kDa polypeptide [Serendipita indica DSM 11827]